LFLDRAPLAIQQVLDLPMLPGRLSHSGEDREQTCAGQDADAGRHLRHGQATDDGSEQRQDYEQGVHGSILPSAHCSRRAVVGV
jgi:hypothetical protein